MKRLTKKERFIIYCIMEWEIENRDMSNEYFHDGFCYMLLWVLGIGDINNGYDKTIILYFPELKSRTPKKKTGKMGLWFHQGDWGERLAILKECIEETAY